MTNTLASQVLSITSEYLGPEAKRFLDRQINHVKDGMEFEEISESDIEKLAWWLFVSGKLIMNVDKAKEMSEKVKSITAKPRV